MPLQSESVAVGPKVKMYQTILVITLKTDMNLIERPTLQYCSIPALEEIGEEEIAMQVQVSRNSSRI